jgi:RNA polymerase sigma-70 factor (ECF subfamily)
MISDATRWAPLIRHCVNEAVRVPLPPHLSREDLVQDALLSVWQSLPAYPGTADELPVWVCALTRRRVADAYRRAASRPRTELLDITNDRPADDDVERDALASVTAIDAHLDGLTRRQRQVLWLLAHDYSTSQIADLLGITRATVLSAVHRARMRLRSA